ncbi:uncharacterized protein METZ01_LOCUS464273, partial [marine metagenome]
RGRSGCWQDNHGWSPDQGAQVARRSRALSDHRAGQPDGTVARRTRFEVPSRVRATDPRHVPRTSKCQPLPRQGLADCPYGSTGAQRGTAGEATSGAGVGFGDLRRGAQDERALFRQRTQAHEALQTRAANRAALPQLSADDGDTPQRQRRGLPGLSCAARRRPIPGQVSRWRPHRGPVRPHASQVKGGSSQVRWNAALPRASLLHRDLRTFRTGGASLRGGHRLRPRRNEPCRAFRSGRCGQAKGQCHL